MKPDQFFNKRDEYRAYLTTPVWKNIKSAALEYYGCVCGRCGEYGTDVHHKTYERVGGKELVEDLEVLCRSCHNAHHRIDNVTRKGKKKKRTAQRGMPIQGALAYLSKAQRDSMRETFGAGFEITAKRSGDIADAIRERIMELLELNYLCEFTIYKKKKNRIAQKFPAIQYRGQKPKPFKQW